MPKTIRKVFPYYDPEIGRFTSEDPARDELNWYVYCGNNPIMFIDPTGYEKESDKEKYGENTTTYIALVKLGDAWDKYTDYRKDIEDLADYIREIVDSAGGAALVDAMIEKYSKENWSGKVLPSNLNSTEKILAVLLPIQASKINDARVEADEFTTEYFGEEGVITDDGNANAFKHAVWNALSIKHIGVLGITHTKRFTNAHEFGSPENPKNSTLMDLHNNDVGRNVGQKLRYSSSDKIKAEIYNKLTNGSLLRVVDGNLVSTNLNE